MGWLAKWRNGRSSFESSEFAATTDQVIAQYIDAWQADKAPREMTVFPTLQGKETTQHWVDCLNRGLHHQGRKIAIALLDEDLNNGWIRIRFILKRKPA